MGGRSRGRSDLGRPPSRKTNPGAAFGLGEIEETPTQSPQAWLQLPEALTALLIPLPYLFVSLAYPRISRETGKFPPGLDVTGDTTSEPVLSAGLEHPLPHGSQLLHAFAIASITLLSVGAISKLQSTIAQPLDRRKPAGKFEHKGGVSAGLFDFSALARTGSNILGILLPLYAALHLGGAATALSLLVAVTAGLGSYDQKPGKHSLWDGVRRTIRTRKVTCAALLIAMVLHVLISASKRGALLGHIALAISVVAIPPPLPTAGWSLMTGLSSVKTLSARASLPKPSSPLISTAEDTLLTLLSGTFLGVVAVLYSLILPSSPSISYHGLAFSALSAATAVLLIFFSLPSALRTQSKSGFALGSFLVAAFGAYEHPEAWQAWIMFPSMCALLFGAVAFDTGSAMFPAHSAVHSHSHSDSGHKHAVVHDHHLHGNHSKLSAFLIARCTPGSIIHSILIEKDSRRIAYFGVLNLGFMLVQFFYGFVTGSLGLLTDSIHMLFDCAGLAVGLAAAVMSKWRPNSRFPYGYGKIDTLSGFANGVFLMLVSVEICFDAFERLWDGHELQRLNELLIVSILGFAVNIVGLTAFGHAHHGHGHSHDHDHGDEGHGHHHHDNENMQGIFLHILADALGSVAVIISTLLTKYYGWSGWDPIASCVIAILIFVSAIPLVKSAGMRLLLSLPADIEYGIRNTLQELSSLRGVVGYAVPKFWLEDEGAAHAEVHAKEQAACGHEHHEHSHGHDHDHRHSHDHSHSHVAQNGHAHSHSHSHGHSHSHADHNHSHSHDHGHDHDHDHAHASGKQKVLGVIHIIASQMSDPEDVQVRTEQFLKDRGMNVVVHVEKEGEGRCWCGGGTKTG